MTTARELRAMADQADAVGDHFVRMSPVSLRALAGQLVEQGEGAADLTSQIERLGVEINRITADLEADLGHINAGNMSSRPLGWRRAATTARRAKVAQRQTVKDELNAMRGRAFGQRFVDAAAAALSPEQYEALIAAATSD